MKRLQSLHKSDRPREKLQAKGSAALSDFELLQALIGSGNKQADVSAIAKDTLKLLRTHGADVTYDQLQTITGLWPARITEPLQAVDFVAWAYGRKLEQDDDTFYRLLGVVDE